MTKTRNFSNNIRSNIIVSILITPFQYHSKKPTKCNRITKRKTDKYIEQEEAKMFLNIMAVCIIYLKRK